MVRQRLVWLSGLPLMLAACASGDEVPASASTGGELEVAQAPAEDAERTQRRLEHRLERMKAELELDDAQVEQLRPILQRTAERRRAQRQQLRDEVAAILTPEQLARFDARFERRGRHGRRGRGRMGGRGRPMEHLVARLELTDAQKTQVEPLLRAAGERRHEIRDLPAEERRAAIEATHAELRAHLVPILDAEQLARFDEISERMRQRFERGRRGRRGQRDTRPEPAPDGIDPNGI